MKKLLIFLSFTLILSCKSTKKVIKVERIESDYFTVVRYESKTDNIWSIDIPIKIKISNKSLKERCFSYFKYQYGNKTKGGGGAMYIGRNGRLDRIGRNQMKCIPFYDSKEYIVYSRHYIDTLSSTQLALKSYIDKMKASNQDTLAVGTLQEFKSKHPELIQRLLTNDTLRLHFDELESKGGGWSYIKLPIQF